MVGETVLERRWWSRRFQAHEQIGVAVPVEVSDVHGCGMPFQRDGARGGEATRTVAEHHPDRLRRLILDDEILFPIQLGDRDQTIPRRQGGLGGIGHEGESGFGVSQGGREENQPQHHRGNGGECPQAPRR